MRVAILCLPLAALASACTTDTQPADPSGEPSAVSDTPDTEEPDTGTPPDEPGGFPMGGWDWTSGSGSSGCEGDLMFQAVPRDLDLTDLGGGEYALRWFHDSDTVRGSLDEGGGALSGQPSITIEDCTMIFDVDVAMVVSDEGRALTAVWDITYDNDGGPDCPALAGELLELEPACDVHYTYDYDR